MMCAKCGMDFATRTVNGHPYCRKCYNQELGEFIEKNPLGAPHVKRHHDKELRWDSAAYGTYKVLVCDCIEKNIEVYKTDEGDIIAHCTLCEAKMKLHEGHHDEG